MKKVKIIVFILMILSSILPLVGLTIPMLMGIPPSAASTVGIIGGADGPTAIYLGAGSALPVIGPFVPTILLFILWLILHIKTKRKN